jgi:hypothetical protein
MVEAEILVHYARHAERKDRYKKKASARSQDFEEHMGSGRFEDIQKVGHDKAECGYKRHREDAYLFQYL